jgi:P27 family predicted phage terminase small subunit
MRGRKPTPSHLKLVTGNPGRRPLNKREPAVNSGAPTPPAELNEFARREWTRLCAQLRRAGLLSTIDRAALAAYCQSYGVWVQAEQALARMAANDPVTFGLMVKTSNGNIIQNPLVGIARGARSDMVRFAVEFGMTPSARSRVQANFTEQAPAASTERKYF